MQFQIHDDFYRIPGRATADDGAEHDRRRELATTPRPGVMWTLVSQQDRVEARYSGFYGVDHGDPLNGGPRVSPRFNDLDTGQITGGIYSWYDGKSEKTAFCGKVTKYAEKFMGGSHDFKLGVQFNSGVGDYASGRTTTSTPTARRRRTATRSCPGMRAAEEVARRSTSTIPISSAGATLNLGLRYDDSKGDSARRGCWTRRGTRPAQSRPRVDKVLRWNSVVAAVRPQSSSSMTRERRLVKLHAGRYYGGIVTSEFDNISPAMTPRYPVRRHYSATGRPIWNWSWSPTTAA